MATTPPISNNIHTPPTPRHGAAYDSYEPYSPRYQTRASSRKFLQGQTTPEPSSSRKLDSNRLRASTPPANQHSPALSPPQTARRSPKRKANNLPLLSSPSSPGESNMDDFAPSGSRNPSSRARIFSSNTVMQDGMLPTPVKTPRKKTVANVQAAARALFQDQPQDLQTMAEAPRRPKKTRRHNGFSLESFSAEDDNTSGQVQIFTDSRDRVPELDTSEDNPFLDRARTGESSSRRVAGTTKRRKVNGAKKDKDVEEAIKNDEGMIYVFRGRKVYRKFDSDNEEEEEIDPDDLGLLEHTAGGLDLSQPIRPLTRKSIKPTRLFQSKNAERSPEAEKEEEAVTDIEDNTEKVEVYDETESKADNETVSTRQDKTFKSLVTKDHLESDSDASQASSKPKTKRVSPFDSWKRVKRATGSSEPSSAKGKKRASEHTESEGTTKKLKA